MGEYIVEGWKYDFVKMIFKSDFEAVLFGIEHNCIVYGLKDGQFCKIYEPSEE